MKKFLSKNSSTLIILSLIIVGFYFFQESKKIKPEDLYRFQPAMQGDVEQSVNANGTVTPVTLINVGTQVSGIVKHLYVDYNDRVKAGQILLELDDSLLMAQIQQSEGNLKNALASYNLAVANEARIKNLYTQEFVSKQDVDQAIQALESSKAQVETVKAQLSRDKTNLQYSIIRSPVSGVVIDRPVDVGQTVAASFQTPTLITIAQDLSKMQINTSFAEADIGNIKVGQKVKFTVDAFPQRSFEGIVKQVRLNPTTVSNVVTYNVVISVNNPDEVLLPGMTAFVIIAVDKHENVLLVPNAALRYKPKLDDSDLTESARKKRDGNHRKNNDQNFNRGKLFVLKDGKPGAIKVEVGLTDGKFTEIKTPDIKAGDKVIVGETQPENTPSSGPGGNMKMRAF